MAAIESAVSREPHQLFCRTDGRLRHFARFLRALRENVLDLRCIRANVSGALTDWGELAVHRVEKNFLAFDASPPGSSALHRNMLDRLRWTQRLVEMIDVADFRSAGICSSNSRRIGDGWTKLFPHVLRILEERNSIAERLRHLCFSIEPHDPARRSEQGLRLGEK